MNCKTLSCSKKTKIPMLTCSSKTADGLNFKIENFAFFNAWSLQTIQFAPNLKTITGFNICTSLVSLDFSSCNQLEIFETTIFFNAWSLCSIQFPPNLKIIQNCAFKNSSRLTSLQIPASVEIIEENSFNSCEQLEQVTFEGPIILGEGAFDNCPRLVGLVYLQNRYVNCIFGKYSELKQSNRFEITACAITREEFEDDSDIVILRCGHPFIKKELEIWTKKQLTCPLCKQRI